MKILLSAFAFCPDWGSEPSVGWNIAMELSKRHQVWVLTESVWKDRVEARMDLSEFPNLTVVYVSIPWMHNLAEHHFNRGITWLFYYYLWQFKTLKVARQLHQEHQFDLAQHVTFVKVNIPSQLYKLPIPFIFGPVGGGECIPDSDFFKDFTKKQKLIEKLRSLHLRLAKLDPWLRACVRNCTCAIGVTKESTAYLESFHPKKTFTLPAISLLEKEIPSAPTAPISPQPVRLLFVGRLLAWKGLHLALEALAEFQLAYPNTKIHLDVLGEGPQLANLIELTKKLNLTENVTFHGNLPRKEVFKAFEKSNGLLFPSLHDSGGFVVIEAMSRFKPAIVLAVGGPDQFVTPECGWKIDATNRKTAIKGIIEALKQFMKHPELVRAKGIASSERVLTHFTNTAQVAKLETLYQEILSSGKN